jgi:deazaflavin-dependent oxidoreductase (nitroreductase family)
MAGKVIKPNAFQKLIHCFLMMAPVSALLAKVLHWADTFMLRLTHNRHTFAGLVGLPIIQIITIGAKTHQPRTKPLVGVIDKEKIALIASGFGRAHNPGWYYNLKANPECDVLFDGRSGKYMAHETAGEEYQRYWQMAVSYYAGYEKYKERAAPRRIPVMVLKPKN